jgi:hypothetical protein
VRRFLQIVNCSNRRGAVHHRGQLPKDERSWFPSHLAEATDEIKRSAATLERQIAADTNSSDACSSAIAQSALWEMIATLWFRNDLSDAKKDGRTSPFAKSVNAASTRPDIWPEITSARNRPPARRTPTSSSLVCLTRGGRI